MTEAKKEINFDDENEVKKNFFNQTGLLELFIDRIDILRKHKEKIMNKFAELKEKRVDKDIVTQEELILYTKILYLYRDQLKKEKEKMDREKIEKESNRDYHDDKNLEEKCIENNEEYEENDVFEILKNVKLDKVDIDYITKGNNKDNLFIDNDKNTNNNVFSLELNQDIKGINDPSPPQNSFNFIIVPFGFIYDNIFIKVDISVYQGLNLHISLALIIFQNIIYLLEFIGLKGKNSIEIVPGLYIWIMIAACELFIFYKLFFKKYSYSFPDSTWWMIFHLFMFFVFKIFLNLLLFLIFKGVIQNESPNKIFIATTSIKIAYLLYFFIYLYKNDGLIRYATLTIIGIVILCISVLISLIWFSSKDFLIEFIICSVEMIFFHLGIKIGICKNSFNEKKLWNTLNLEVFELTAILFPAMAGAYGVLTIATFGTFPIMMKAC
jgi:hypothetical protein